MHWSVIIPRNDWCRLNYNVMCVCVCVCEREREREREREIYPNRKAKAQHLEENLLIIKDSKGRASV